MSDHFKESLVVQTNIKPGSDKGSFRPCHDVLHNHVMINEDNNNKTGRTMMMMAKSTVAAIHYNDDTTKTPVLSPPSSPELEICPDKGIYSNNNENDDDDDDIFQYKEKHQEDLLSESPKHFKEQESLDHESTSINYFYRDFDTDKKKNNEDNADLVFQQQQLPKNEFIMKDNMNKEVPDYQSIITTPIDLTGFAKELYDNRLSIVHSRESKLILTEQDELEFAKLMEIRRKSQLLARQRKKDEKMTQWPPLPTSTRIQEEEEYACEKIEWNEPIQKDLLPSSPAFEKEKESSLPFVSNKIVTTQQGLTITTNDSNHYDIGATSMESPCSSSQATSSPVTTPVTHHTSSFISDSNNSTMVPTPIARSSLPSVSPKPTRSRGFSLQKLRNPIENTTSWLPKKKLARLSDNSVASASSSTSSSSSKSVKQQQKRDIYDNSDKTLVEEEEENPIESIVEQELEGEKRPSISTRSKSSSNTSRSSRFKELGDMDLSQVAADIGINKEPPPPPAPTSDQQQQSSSPSPIYNLSSAFNSETNPSSGSSRTMSLNLFGSFRNRARSQSTSSIKGLMRNFSTTNVIPQRNNNINQQQQSQQGLKKKRSNSALSPAALAVLKHNAQGHNKKKGSSTNNNNSSTTTTAATSTITTTNDEDDSTMNNNQSKGKRLLSQLLSTARLSRRAPKKVNMDQDNSNNDAKKARAQIVRRTIIYVQPDSENFLQNIEKNHIPSIPSSSIPSRSTFSTRQESQHRLSTPDSDDDQGSQQTATMITRQTSIKRQVSKRQVSKRHNNNSNTTNYDEEQQQQQKQLEGVEVREMSDGTVVWGVVKKLGKRKSFFIASEDSSDYESKLQVNEEAQDETKGEEEEIDEEDEDEEQIEERVLTLMGLSPDLLKNYPNNINYESAITTPTTPVVTPPPIPKRSPHRLREQKLQRERQQQEQLEQEQATYISSYSNRRDSSTTDVYYAHGATLPSLLEMIASDQGLSPKENPTVEEQLDEVMRSLGYTEGHTL